MEQYSFKDLQEGKKFDFGTFALSEEEIIAFAKQFDPLEFHIDKEAAERSRFKGLIASGPHIFTVIHRKEWIPRFGHSVIAGLGVDNWKFLKPVYANMAINSFVKVLAIKPNPEKKHAAIRWQYEFRDDSGELVQILETVVLHNML